MTDDELSHLSLDEKMRAVRFLIADLAACLLSEDETVAQKARHDLGGLAMTFTNMHQLLTSSPSGNLKVVKSIYEKYRYQSDDPSGG